MLRRKAAAVVLRFRRHQRDQETARAAATCPLFVRILPHHHTTQLDAGTPDLIVPYTLPVCLCPTPHLLRRAATGVRHVPG